MAPYFSTSTVGNVNNFHGLWIYNEHPTIPVTNGIKIESAGGGFTNDITLQSGNTIRNTTAGSTYLSGNLYTTVSTATNAGALGGVASAQVLRRQITATIGDGTNVISTGTRHIPIDVVCNMTLTGWSIKQAVPTNSTGSVKIAVIKYSSYPSASSYIVGSSTPTMTSVYWSSGTASGWATSLSAGDTLDFIVQVAAVAKRIVLNLFGVAR
jgi:hypothetical protein